MRIKTFGQSLALHTWRRSVQYVGATVIFVTLQMEVPGPKEKGTGALGHLGGVESKKSTACFRGLSQDHSKSLP